MSLDSLPGEVASTGSESELNDVYLADFLTRDFPYFCDTQLRVFFQIYYADSLLHTSRFHNFKYKFKRSVLSPVFLCTWTSICPQYCIVYIPGRVCTRTSEAQCTSEFYMHYHLSCLLRLIYVYPRYLRMSTSTYTQYLYIRVIKIHIRI
jgi:hypothetical protein